MAKLTVLTTNINVININNEDYICLTDMLKAKDGDFFISDWLRNRNTLEFLGTWELIYNPDFKVVEFDHFKSEAGLHTFVLSTAEQTEGYGRKNLCTVR